VRLFVATQPVDGRKGADSVNPRAYLHLVTTLIINRWPNAKLRELLPDRLAVAHPELLVQDGALRGLLLGPTATAS
jgi:hypothetical protein